MSDVSSSELRAMVERLRVVGYSAVVSDCCDQVGLRDQAMASGILPVSPDMPVLVGLARPSRSVAVAEAPTEPYSGEIDFIDSLESDDVVVATVDAPSALWGELFSTAARARGAVGAVVDGLIRDQRQISELGFPVLARGGRPADSLGRTSLVDRDVTINVAGVDVSPGDMVVADIDGVVVVPRSAALEVGRLAIEKATTENHAREMLEGGAYLRDAWQRFRVM